MIAKLTGKIDTVNLTELIIDVNGVGYEVFIPLSTYDRISAGSGKDVSLLIHTQVREDAITLYGFATEAEKKLFVLLQSVSGIGAKLALNILSSVAVETFCHAVANGELAAVNRINGIGKKTAERLIIELRDKLEIIVSASPGSAAAPDKGPADAAVIEDAVLALEQLGFKRDKARKSLLAIVHDLPEKEQSSENLIRLALQALNS